MAFDYRKFGKPRTEEERRRRHKRLYGTSKVPPRGTGLKENPSLLAWRERVGRGRVMSPSTFQSIKEEAKRRYGLSEERARKVAGKAYWETARAKFREYLKKRKGKRSLVADHIK